MNTFTPDFFEQVRNNLDLDKWVTLNTSQFQEFKYWTKHKDSEFLVTEMSNGLLSVKFK